VRRRNSSSTSHAAIPAQTAVRPGRPVPSSAHARRSCGAAFPLPSIGVIRIQPDEPTPARLAALDVAADLRASRDLTDVVVESASRTLAESGLDCGLWADLPEVDHRIVVPVWQGYDVRLIQALVCFDLALLERRLDRLAAMGVRRN